MIHSIDKSSSYTSGQLVDSLVSIIQVYQPTAIHAQSSYPGIRYLDHSDHNTVSSFVTQSRLKYSEANPDQLVPSITYYIGYPVHEMPANIEGTDLNQKTAAFLAFGRFDGAVCHSVLECDTKATYGLYLNRQYTHDN